MPYPNMPYANWYNYPTYPAITTAPYTQNQQPINGLTQVVGIEGARAYQVPPNSSVPLFDSNNDILYVKSTDASGFPTIRTFDFVERKETAPAQPDTSTYVTKEDFDALNQKIDSLLEELNGK